MGVTALGLAVLRRHGRTLDGEPIVIPRKLTHRGTWVGGAVFGVGWAITGMCPGPVIVNLGEGKLYALAAFAGVLTGTYLVGYFHGPLRVLLGLPVFDKPVKDADHACRAARNG